MPREDFNEALARDPEWKRWEAHVRDELVPMIRGSALSVSLVPEGPPDIKWAVELGLSIMLEKPIVLIVRPGTKVPRKLRQLADGVIEADLNDPRASAQVADRIERIVKTVKATDDG